MTDPLDAAVAAYWAARDARQRPITDLELPPREGDMAKSYRVHVHDHNDQGRWLAQHDFTKRPTREQIEAAMPQLAEPGRYEVNLNLVRPDGEEVRASSWLQGTCQSCGCGGTEQHGEPAHADYPHEPGRLYDCPACEAKCHCTPGYTQCVFTGEHNGTADDGQERHETAPHTHIVKRASGYIAGWFTQADVDGGRVDEFVTECNRLVPGDPAAAEPIPEWPVCPQHGEAIPCQTCDATCICTVPPGGPDDTMIARRDCPAHGQQLREATQGKQDTRG